MKGTHQPTVCKRGDIVRVRCSEKNEEEFWNKVAVVVSVDRSKDNGRYPYMMRLLDHDYDGEIWLNDYEVLGNVAECVTLLRYLKRIDEMEKRTKKKK